MEHLDDAVDHRDREPEEGLAQRFERSGGGIGHHVKGEYDESGAGHGHERDKSGSAKDFGANDALQDEAEHPCADEGKAASEKAMDDNSGEEDKGGQKPAPAAGQVGSEMVGRSKTDLGEKD